MKAIQFDVSKLLGYRIAARDAAVGDKLGQQFIVAKLGSKLGAKWGARHR